MPFMKKNNRQDALIATSHHAIFIGRTKELLFFPQHILKPKEPTYNILSVWGQGGVGKTTLLFQWRNQTQTADFRAYCLAAMVDDRQATPANMMEKFAQQLHLPLSFEKALSRYKEAVQLLRPSKPSNPLPQTMIRSAPDITGALFEGIPLVGPLLRESAKAATEQVLDLYQTSKEGVQTAKLNDPLETLTQAFIAELNHIATTQEKLPSGSTKRERRILLFFDTFEQVADEVIPWLLCSVLKMEINPNIVFIIAGRNPIERSTVSGPKQWLPYYETHTIYSLHLQLFTQEETSAYLVERGITLKGQIDSIWQLSHGLPLYLGLLTSNTQIVLDLTKDVVDNFLYHIREEEQMKRQLALDAALFSKPFNLDDLDAFSYLSKQNRPSLYAWLIRQSFVRASSLQGRYIYHDLAQELFQRHLYQISPKIYFTTRRALTEYYEQVLEQLQTIQERNMYGPSEERLEVMLALVSQRFFLPDEESHLQTLSSILDIWEYENIEQIQTMLRTLQKTVQILSQIQTGSHAHQVAQALLRFFETCPTQFDQTHEQEWFVAKDQLIEFIEHTSSPELLAHTYEHCGWGYLRLKAHQQGLKWLERALELNPHSITIHNGLGFAHYHIKNYQQALEHFDKGIQLAPHHPLLYVGRGKVYGRLKDYQQALSNFNRAIQLDRNLRAYNNRGRIYLELKEYHKALADWDHWLEAAPEHPRIGGIQFQRGCVYLWLKDTPQAVICFTRSYEFASTQAFFSWAQDFVLWAREWSAMCQVFSHQHALRHLEAIASGNHYTAYVCRGVIFFLHKKFQQALTVLQHATTLHYDENWYFDLWADFWREWDAHFWLAMVHFALYQEEDAKKEIEQALILEMPPILLKPLTWFKQDNPKLYERLIKPLLDTYNLI